MLRCQGHPPYDWSVIEIDDPGDRADEQMGTKDKFWFHSDDGTRWLFKEVRLGNDGRARGEDWAECAVHAVAQLLGIPSACVALARHESVRGVVVRSMLGPDEELVHGDELLGRVIRGYERELGRRNPMYTVENIRLALVDYSAPTPYTGWRAFDVPAGYLMMDALVAGRDRHHENWSVICGGEHDAQLAPSFDHGNALGFAEPVDNVERLLREEARLEDWLEKGKKESRGYFVERLRALPVNDLATAVAQMPKAVMSEPHRRLALEIVRRNRRRLLDAFRACGVSS